MAFAAESKCHTYGPQQEADTRPRSHFVARRVRKLPALCPAEDAGMTDKKCLTDGVRGGWLKVEGIKMREAVHVHQRGAGR